MNISDLSEFELIARLTKNLMTKTGDIGVGDDCAVLDLHGPELLLATCDSQVEGIHFTLQSLTPEEIGHKALAINISDIAAMGGKPLYALISLILPATLSVVTLDGIYAGLRAIANAYDTTIVGGNIAGSGSSEVLIIDVTLLGTVEHGHALVRSGAQIGDLLCVTGTLGGSAAGLYTFLHPSDATYPVEALSTVRAVHTRPTPRVLEGRILSRFGPNVITSMLDISDGLSGDLGHLCERSSVGMNLEVERIPMSKETRAIAMVASQDAVSWALHGGEDYELLFTVSPTEIETVKQVLAAEATTPITVIGHVVAEDEGMQLVYGDGRKEILSIQSWDHLKH